MQKYHPDQYLAVEKWLREAASNDPGITPMLNHAGDIAKRIADADGFERPDGFWVLPDHVMHDWFVQHESEYRTP